MTPPPLRVRRGQLDVEWRELGSPGPEWEAAHLNVVRRIDRDLCDVREVTGMPDYHAHRVTLAYRASIDDIEEIQEEIKLGCTRHGAPPAKLAVVACGWSDADVVNPLTGYDGTCQRHDWAHVTEPAQLEAQLEQWMRTTAGRLEMAPGAPAEGYSTESLIQSSTPRRRLRSLRGI